MKSFIRVLLFLTVAYGCFSLGFLINVLYSSSYNGFIKWVSEVVLKKPHLVKFIPAYFNDSQFYLLQKTVVLVAVIYFIFIIWLFKRNERVVNYLIFIAGTSKVVLKSFFVSVYPKERHERILFYIITGSSFIIGAYNIFTIPVSYDEAVSYIDFVSKGPLVISTLYHTTNNHILSNMLSYISCLVFPKGEVGQRMPLLFIFLINCFLLYGLLKRVVKVYPALIGLAFFAASTPVYLYSFMARGYSLVILFVLVCLLAFRQILQSNDKRFWIIFFISSVLGTYTIPIMAYLIIAMYIYLGVIFIIADKRRLKYLFITGFFSLVAVCFLYASIFLVSGFSAMKQVISEIGTNRTLIENILRNFKVFTNFYISSNLFLKVVLGLPVLAGIFYLYRFFRTGGSKFLLFLLIVGVIPLPVTIILRQGMFDRTWIYMAVLLSVFYAFAFSQINRKAVLISAVFFTYVVQLFSSVNARYYCNQKHQIFAARKTADYFANKKIKSIYLDHQFIRPMIEYRLQVLKHPYDLYVKKSQFQKSDFDPSKNYSLIVYAEGSAPPQSNWKYRLLDSVKEIRVLELIGN